MADIILNADRTITIKNMVIRNDELYSFLEECDNKEEALRKALTVGVVGLRSMGTDVKIDYVDKRFNQFMNEIEKKFAEQHAKVEGLIKETFDEDNARSPMFKLAKNLENYFNDKNGIVRTLINNTFDPENRKSPVGAMMQNIDSYFNDDGTLRRLLDSHFDLNSRTSSMSQLVDKLSENFDVDKGTIRKLLDPNREGSPVNQFKREVVENLNDIKERFAVAKREEELREKMTQKGVVFEDLVYEELHRLCNQYMDGVSNVAKVRGPQGDVGDFVIKAGQDNIVVEAKDSSGYTVPKTIDEIQRAMENRKAQFGIFLFKTQEQMPNPIKPVKIDRNYVITSLEGSGLYYAYRLAKIFLENERKSNGPVHIEKIQEEAEYIRNKSMVIDEVIKKTRLVSSHVESIEDTLMGLHSEIDQSLKRIQNHLNN